MTPYPTEIPRPADVPLTIARTLLVGLLTIAIAAASSATRANAGPSASQDSGPLRQSELATTTAPEAMSIGAWEASRDDRWLGLGVRDVRWALDGSAVFFRWNLDPRRGDDPDADPWFRVGRSGAGARPVDADEPAALPPADPVWSSDGRQAVWVDNGSLMHWDAGGGDARRLVALATPARAPRFDHEGDRVLFMMGEDLYAYDLASGELRQRTRRHTVAEDRRTDAERWLEQEQARLLDRVRRDRERADAAAARARAERPEAPQPVPVPEGWRVESLSESPDGRWIAYRLRRPADGRFATQYLDYVADDGNAAALDARPKVGSPQERVRMAVIEVDPGRDPEELAVRWVTIPDAEDREPVVHGPWWSPDGERAVIQAIAADHKDLWIAELDPASATARTIAHDHDDAWLGGPPIQPNYLQPPLLAWLPGGELVFASERGGWSHLYAIEPDGAIRALTEGAWEVRGAELSRDRSRWLLTTSREHPSDDHVYLMPAAGGDLVRLTAEEGRHTGFLSPDGARMAMVSSDSTSMPDLWITDARAGAPRTRVTVSGTDNYFRHPLARPEIVHFPHPDGDAVWAALFRPETPNAERAAVLHIHGGGYRQFSHRGWSVYGYADHLGIVNHLLSLGYTVLDFDYRGSAGFGRDYRTDIYRSMGDKDVSGGVAAAQYLAAEHGIDADRIGLYGVSYGGFFTLMALFRHPGVFAAGIANASVTDWAHYNHGWTSRILNLPWEDPEAYRSSSPIYWADGLQDNLLLVHSLTDSNVQFQDAARLVQRLIELEKPFDLMVYPKEPHVIATEESRYDYVRRLAEYFDRHLLR